jgi:hypothetical protein
MANNGMVVPEIVDTRRDEMYALIERLSPKLTKKETKELTKLCRDLFTGWAYFMIGPGR